MDVPAQRQKLSKLLYHCYTKLFELGRILSGQDPVVHMCGEERRFIMTIRACDGMCAFVCMCVCGCKRARTQDA